MVKKYKETRKKKVIKELEKEEINKHIIFLGTFILIITLILIVFYSSFIQIRKESEKYQGIQTPIITEPKSVVGGFCKRDSECFITTCRDSQIKDCVNTTQLTDYHENCKIYSDWIVEMQDPSECACIQNVCKTMK